MRCHYIVILLLIALICFGAGGADPSGVKNGSKSNLEEVYGKFATITRITNAITLQAEGLRKNVKVRDVIVELLKADQTVFSTLIDYKPESLKTALTGLIDKLKVLRSKVRWDDWDGLEKTKGWLEEFDKGFQKFKNHTKFEEKEMTSFAELVYDDTATIQFETWITFFSSFRNTWLKLSSKTKAEAESALDVLKRNCSQFIQELSQFQPTITWINFTVIFFELDDSLFTYNMAKEPFGKSHSKSLDVVEKIFKETDGIWVDPKRKTGKVGEPFKFAVSKLKEMLKVTKRPEVKLTIGFPESRDIAKVSDDLKSEWFLQKVIGGKSVEHLRKELAGFFKFGELIKTVEDSWEAFATEFNLNEGVADKMSKEMDAIEAFEGGPDGERLLKNGKSSFQAYSRDAMNAAEWKPYEMVFEKARDLNQKLEQIRGALLEILKTNKYKNLQEELENLQKDSTTLVDIGNDNKFQGLKQTLGQLNGLMISLNEYIELRKTFLGLYPTAEDVEKKLKTVARTLGDFETGYTNLTTDGFDAKKLLQMITFLKNVRLLSGEHGDPVMSVLEKFSKLREDVFKAESFVKNVKSKYKENHSPDNPILKLKHPEELLLSLGRGMYVLRDMSKALVLKNDLIAFTQFPQNFTDRYKNFVSAKFFNNNKKIIYKLLEELDGIDKFSSGIKDKGLMTMRTIFDEAANRVVGFPEAFPRIAHELPVTQAEKEMEIVKRLAELDLDFVSHKGYLQAASLSFEELRMYYDEIFGLNKKKEVEEQNYLVPILICITIFLLLLIGFVAIFGLTKTGRKFFKNWYLYYFAKPADFEKRWRYSVSWQCLKLNFYLFIPNQFFMDRQDMKNSLIDAVREINTTNVLKAVKNGAYINVYNDHGNTPLHLATKRCYPEIVEILIKNGADRSALNSMNKTPEQMIPANWRTSHTTQTEHLERFEKIEKIYKKYRNKKFRLRVPQEFPSSSFHIFINEKVDDEQAEKFIKKFQAITTNDPIPTTTHCIVKTDSNGILEIDTMDMVCWINSGVIMVKESWMTDCLDNEKLIERDCDYLVEKVKYKDVVYDTVIPWAQAMAKGEMPYLHGVYVCLFIEDYKFLDALTTMTTAHGGIFCMSDKIPDKSFLKVGAHPYLHAHLGPIFVLYDQTTDVAKYRNDPDKMYTLFTEEEFAAFMLKRGINVDTRPDPIPLVTETEN
ncbi:hypothetical protein GCK72_009065 [Caenorhabditis remanei]|uniref:BRCT domain-containing protein n=1 Tax=Caenorhabditis remanei TaxID=31234 RepID=A0A6A5H1L4_CAERE|nr:hypothetical protein GCK72_009065 [Caenorhabditis remanei]KAF1760815.1 hypothetical protein GCK72_009065 [Caenorhabditis remanei]